MKKMICCLVSPLLLLMTGCVTNETVQRDTATQNVGNFPPPPAGAVRGRVGVPPFSSTTDIAGYSVTGNELDIMAADQLTTLMHKTRRFDVIERAQLEQMLREQDLEGIVKEAELAKMGQVDGVDYLLLGKITAFRVKRVQSDNGLNITGKAAQELLGGWSGGVNKNSEKITTEVGVDLRLINPETGRVRMAEFSEFERTDSASGFGFRYAGFSTGGDSDIRLGRDDAGQVLRLAFNDALLKALPEIDRVLQEDKNMLLDAQKKEGAAPGAAVPSAPADGEQAFQFCPRCGTKTMKAAKFCPTDGQPL